MVMKLNQTVTRDMTEKIAKDCPTLENQLFCSSSIITTSIQTPQCSPS